MYIMHVIKINPLNGFVVFVCTESSANNGSGNEACLTVEALDALGFLITGATDSRLVIASNNTLCMPISQDLSQEPKVQAPDDHII